ncbi:hypothetical protein QWZ06_13810 [Chryseobacterium tructae]|uniref:Group-specific protein n=1 Tax=Chryseobacterium tructae TaxID=1037380 RepID=A0ABV7XX28_9FLAO|nr:hypothetical protein [Chryseobacterium tructae]MDN3693283.1 hypothetical protein [Chryseobacterium tructae]
MLSSADLHLERALLIVALMIFFGVGFFCMFLVFIINSIQKKNKSGHYYFFLFLISGTIALSLAAFYFSTMLMN